MAQVTDPKPPSLKIAQWVTEPQPPMAKGQSGPQLSFIIFEDDSPPDLSGIAGPVEILDASDPRAKDYLAYHAIRQKRRAA